MKEEIKEINKKIEESLKPPVKKDPKQEEADELDLEIKHLEMMLKLQKQTVGKDNIMAKFQ